MHYYNFGINKRFAERLALHEPNVLVIENPNYTGEYGGTRTHQVRVPAETQKEAKRLFRRLVYAYHKFEEVRLYCGCCTRQRVQYRRTPPAPIV